MPGRDAILCNDCSLLFTTGPSILGYIPIPKNHRLHQLLFKTDLTRAGGLANDCHFCSLLVRTRSRANKLEEDGSKSIYDSPAHGIFLSVSHGITDDYLTIDIVKGRGLLSRPLWRNSKLILFNSTDSRISDMYELDRASTVTSSDATFATLTRWINTCEKHHLCRRPTKASEVEAQHSWLPSRLVQIDTSSVRVIQTADHSLAIDSRYVTLSYCWGPPPITFTRLLRANVEDMTAGIDVTALPKTFQDAITATSLLGLSLIWIDALCIIQDSDEDWRYESMQMSEVYSQAHINLTAVASVDVHGGLFRTRNLFSLNPFNLKINWPHHLEGSVCCVPEDPWVAAIRDSPLFTRAWTFQERLLSARTVYFAEDQLYWECGELCASEIYPFGSPFDPGPREKPSDPPRRPLDDQPILKSGRIKEEYALLKSFGGISMHAPGFLNLWTTLVETYSKGRLTFPRDRLMAISGVARQLSDHHTNENYYLGLWRPHILPLLLWRDLGPAKTSESHHSPIPSRMGPSWSWSSHLNPVDYFRLKKFESLKGPKVCAEVLEIDATPGVSPLAQDGFEFGRLIIKAPLVRAKISRSTEIILNPIGPLSRSFYRPSGGILGKTLRQRTPLWFPQEDVLIFPDQGMQTDLGLCHVSIDSSFDKGAGSDVICVKLAITGARHSSTWDGRIEFGLILSHTGEKGQFKRIGCFKLHRTGLVRSWRAGRWLWRLQSRNFEDSKERLFQSGNIEPRFYQDFDGVDAYTIEIV